MRHEGVEESLEGKEGFEEEEEGDIGYMAAKGRMSSKKKSGFFKGVLGGFFFSFPFLGGGEGGNRVDVGRMKKSFFFFCSPCLRFSTFAFGGKVSFLSFFFSLLS
mgnify:CR=1 FL=1